MQVHQFLRYQLDNEFIDLFPENRPNSTGLSVCVNYRTYFRNIFDNEGNIIGKESYKDMIRRVVNGTGTLYIEQLERAGNLNDETLKKVDADMRKLFTLMFQYQITPPGRGLWAMGTELVHVKRMALSLVNCTFITSENIDLVRQEFFAFVMDSLMLGVGVGFDDKGRNKLTIQPNKIPTEKTDTEFIISKLNDEFANIEKDIYARDMLKKEIEFIKSTNGYAKIITIADSREGWVESLRELISSYLDGTDKVVFDISKIRKKGTPLKTFGGTACGPIPLIKGLSQIRILFEEKINKKLDSLLICDITNIIATVVVAGNVRRSSQIFISDNPEMIKIKNYDDPKYSYRSYWGWSSNNSVRIGNNENYPDLLEKMSYTIKKQGEPGIFNEYLSKNYGRIKDGCTGCDLLVIGTNPCGEVSLEGKHEIGSNKKFSAGGETCNLTEVHLSNYSGMTKEKEIKTIKKDIYLALLYCKLVTTIDPHWESTKEIQNKNRRIGISQTGIRTFLAHYDISIEEYGLILDDWYNAVREYDSEISAMLGINKSIKLTTIKPSGTVTLCGGGYAAGMHATPAKYFIRNVRAAKEQKEFINVFKKKGYLVEDCCIQPDTTSIISFPCKAEENEITKEDLTIENQFKLLATLQRYWADNQVSCTITFKEEEAEKIIPLLLEYKDDIKAVSFLKLNTKFYPQSPEIIISKEEYELIKSKVQPIMYSDFLNDRSIEEESDMYCSGDKCVMTKS